MARQFFLRVHRGGDPVGCAVECDEKSVALGIDFITTVLGQNSAQNGFVFGEQLWITIAEPVQQLCRSLYIGKEERDRARRDREHIR